MNGLVQVADRDRVKVGQKKNAKCFDNTIRKTKAVRARAPPGGIEVTFFEAQEDAAGGSTSFAASHRRYVTWCSRPWVADTTARRLPPTRLARPLPAVAPSTSTFRCASMCRTLQPK